MRWRVVVLVALSPRHCNSSQLHMLDHDNERKTTVEAGRQRDLIIKEREMAGPGLESRKASSMMLALNRDWRELLVKDEKCCLRLKESGSCLLNFVAKALALNLPLSRCHTSSRTPPIDNTARMPKEVKQRSGIAVGLNAGHVRSTPTAVTDIAHPPAPTDREKTRMAEHTLESEDSRLT